MHKIHCIEIFIEIGTQFDRQSGKFPPCRTLFVGNEVSQNFASVPAFCRPLSEWDLIPQAPRVISCQHKTRMTPVYTNWETRPSQLYRFKKSIKIGFIDLCGALKT